MAGRKIVTAIAALILSASALHCFAGDRNSMGRNICVKEQMTESGIILFACI